MRLAAYGEDSLTLDAMRRSVVGRRRTRPLATPPGTPSGGAHGLGRGFVEMPCSRGQVMLHTGSNSMNLAMVTVQPARDFAVAVATNRPDARADEALEALQEALFRAFAPPG